jgi:hypothetical protein
MIPYFNNAKKLLSRNASDLLLVGGVGCMLVGGILAIKQTPKALKIIEKKKEHTTVEKVKILTPLYIPSVLLTGIGITQIICSRNITNNKLAAVATAYTVSESAFRTYREKVRDIVEPEKYEEIQREVATEKIRRDPLGNREITMSSKGHVLMYDEMSGRYFRSNINQIDRVANIINKRLRNEMEIQLNDFYREIDSPDLDVIKIGCDVGWNIDKYELDISYGSSIADNDEPCIVLQYDVTPIK